MSDIIETRFIERKVDNIAWVSNGSSTLQLPRNHVYQGLNLYLTGTCTKPAALPTGKFSLTPARLIKKIEIVADGRNTVKSIDGKLLTLLNRYDYGTDPVLTDVSTIAPPDNFVLALHLPFKLTRARRPMDCYLDPRRLSSLDLKIEWGSEADLYAVVNSAVLSNVTLQIETEELDIPADKVIPGGLINRHSFITKTVTATTSELQELLPTETIYRRIALYCESNNVASNVLLNSVNFRMGNYVFKNVRFPIHRAVNKREYGVETLEDGFMILDLISDGSLAEAINLKNVKETVDMLFDVTASGGTDKIHILKEEVLS